MAPDPENFRGVHAVRVLKDQKGFTLDKLIDAAYDPFLPAFEVMIPGLVSAFNGAQLRTPDTNDAIDALRNWDYKASADSVPMSLAHYYGEAYLRSEYRPKDLGWMDAMIYAGRDLPNAQRINLFHKAIDKLENDFGTWETPWGEINRFQRPNGDIKLTFDDDAPSIPVGLASGRWGALAAYGQRGEITTKKIYGTRGNSFVAVVEFGEKVKAKTLLAGGQSGDPDSPHFYDQAQSYADIEFKDVAYYEDDVLARAQRTYHPGE